MLIQNIKEIYKEQQKKWFRIEFNNLTNKELDSENADLWILGITDENYYSPSELCVELFMKRLDCMKIMQYFTSNDESHLIPWHNCKEILQKYVDKNLKLGTPEWKERMTLYKTGDETALAILQPGDNPCIIYWNLIRGMIFETFLTTQTYIMKYIDYIQNVNKKQIKEYKDIKLSILYNVNKTTGCVPDLLLFITYETGEYEICILEIKSITFDFNPNTRKTSRSISISSRQLNKTQSIINDILSYHKHNTIIVSKMTIIGDNHNLNICYEL